VTRARLRELMREDGVPDAVAEQVVAAGPSDELFEVLSRLFGDEEKFESRFREANAWLVATLRGDPGKAGSN